MEKSTINSVLKIYLFPTRLVQVVTAYGWFLSTKPALGGSLGFSSVVLATQINVVIHLLLACIGVSYWELCSANSEVKPIVPYMFINSVIWWPLFRKYVDNDKCLQELNFTYSSISRKLLGLIGFFCL